MSRESSVSFEKESHTPEKLIQCDLCETKCKSQIGLGVHKYRRHNVTSQKNQQKVKKVAIEKEVRIEIQGFQCQVCDDFRATSLDLVKQHNSEKHQPKDKPAMSFNCPICQKGFNSSRALKFHKRTLHGNGIELKKSLKDKPKKCSICKMTLSSISNLHRHIKIVHGESRNIQTKTGPSSLPCGKETSSRTTEISVAQEDKVISPTNLQSNSECQDEEAVGNNTQTDIGDDLTAKSKPISTKRNLSEKKFKCSVCDAIISTQFNLARHIRTFHEGKTTEQVKRKNTRTPISLKKFECSVSNFKFGLIRSSLLRHNRTAHSALLTNTKRHNKVFAPSKKGKIDEEDLECQFIKEVKCSNVKNRQLIKEKKEKAERSSANDYQCSICLEVVSGRKGLIRHKLSEHGSRNTRRNVTRAIMYECPRCDVRFTTIALLKYHEKQFH